MAASANFGTYYLSKETKDILRNYEASLKSKATSSSNSTWPKLFSFEGSVMKSEPIYPMEMDIDESFQNESVEQITNKTTIPSSQFVCTQIPKKISVSSGLAKNDTLELIFESLTKADGVFNGDLLRNLSDADFANLVDKLAENLSLEGTYELCSSICDMETDVGIQFIETVCSKLLLQKIIESEMQSRRIASVITKMSEKYPEDIRRFIFIPIINLDLKDHTTIATITKAYVGPKRMELIVDFLTNVRVLRPWHVPFLPSLLDVKLEDAMKDSLLKLLVETGTKFSRDTMYSKLIIDFIKLNAPFTEDQKRMLDEIATVNMSKNNIAKILKNMYFHRDLWHK